MPPKRPLSEIYGEAQQPQTATLDGKRSLDDLFQTSQAGITPMTPSQPQTVLGAGVEAGIESALNVPRSAFEFGKGIVDIARHPVETGKGIFGLVKGGGERLGREILERIPSTKERVEQVPESVTEASFNELGKHLKARYGSLEALEKTATEDPFGFGIDVLATVTGGAGLVGRTGMVAKGIEAVGGPVTRAVGRGIKKPISIGAEATKFGVGQATGLSRPTISTIFKRGDDIKLAQARGATRVTLGEEIGANISKRLDDLSDLGKEYNAVRASTQIVEIKPSLIDDVLKSQGFIIRDGKIFTTRTSATRNTADISALQNLYGNWGGASKLTPTEFLNFRSDLAELAKFDLISGKTRASQTVAKSIRVELNKQGRPQMKGLKELDAEFATERTTLGTVKKDWLDKDGTLKDAAYSKAANLTQANKKKVLSRLEKVMPGISDQVEIVRALEDIERAKGLKVGTYLRAGVIGGGLVTGNPLVIIASILASPELAVSLIKGLGLANNKVQPLLNVVFRMMKDVNNLTLTGSALRAKIKEYIDNPKLGASIEDVSDLGHSPIRTTQQGQVQGKQLNKSSLDNTTVAKELQPLAKEAQKYKSAEEFVASQTDPLYEFKNKELKVFATEFKGRAEVVEIIDDIGGIKNVERGNIELNKLRPTETFDASNNGVKRAIEEIESGVRIPLIVEFKKPNFYEIMDGNHRFKAHEILGTKEVPIIVNKGGLKDVPTKSQLTDIFNEANK